MEDWGLDIRPEDPERPLELPDFIFDQEVRPIAQLGVRDPDFAAGDELELSPLYQIIPAQGRSGPFLDLSDRDRLKFLKSGMPNSPKFLMASRDELISENADATFLLDARSATDRLIPGSFFPLSASFGASAVHMIKDEHGQHLSMWRVGLFSAWRRSMFNSPDFRRVFLDAVNGLPVSPEPNRDPILNSDHWVVAAGERSDIGLWKVTEEDRFQDSNKPKKADRFEKFWLPCSLELEAPEPLQAACGMISYPFSSLVRDSIRSRDPVKRSRLCADYTFLRKDEYLRQLEIEAERCKVDVNTVRLGDEFAAFRKALSKKLCLEIEQALQETFESVRDGDSVLSIGTVIGYNSTMVATSLSALAGSSGGPIFLLKPDLKRVFFAVLNGPPMIAANYNLATSTDNPTFVLQYLSTVLDTLPLPPPSDSYWKNQKQQLHCFSRWLVKHVATLRSVAVTENQQAWLAFADEVACIPSILYTVAQVFYSRASSKVS